jgi:hypothetical protein
MSYLTQQFENKSVLAQYPWLEEMAPDALDCNPDNFWCFLEFEPQVNSEVNEKFLKFEERQNGFKLIKVKILENTPDFEKSDKKHYQYCQVRPEDVFTLELSPKEIDNGIRYLKVHQPHKYLRQGWLTETERENGWKVAKPFKVSNKTQKRRKNKKTTPSIEA